jgi:hypothetical protein
LCDCALEPFDFAAGQPIEAWYSSPKMMFARWDLGLQASIFRSELADQQGKIVPRFHGLYLAEYWSLLVTEDCGPMVSERLEHLPESER